MDHLAELVKFLASPQPEVYSAALEALLPSTQSSKGHLSIFTAHDYAGVKSIMHIFIGGTCQSQSLSALVNLTSDPAVRDLVAENQTFIAGLVGIILCMNSETTELACMLLLNLSHSKELPESLKQNSLYALVVLTQSCKDKSLDFLLLAFSELAKSEVGKNFLIGKSFNDEKLPLAHLCPDLVCASASRRTGVAATVKNLLFDINTHSKVLESGAIEYIMIALKGPETMDPRDKEELPEVVRDEFDEHKKREPSPSQQLVLIEALLLLSSSVVGREGLRKLHTYYIVRELHLAAESDEVKTLCEKFVNMVMRGEPGAPPSNDTEQSPKIVEEDEEIIEVV